MTRVGVFVRLCWTKDILKRHSCSLTIKTVDSEEEPIHTSPAFYAVVKESLKPGQTVLPEQLTEAMRGQWWWPEPPFCWNCLDMRNSSLFLKP